MMNRGVLSRQMFAQGGAAVPKEYKGFSKLPEDVQMKMDPVAAKKYAEGGDVAMEQRQRDNIEAFQAIRDRAQAQTMGANQYGVPLTGLDDVSRADASEAEDFDPNNLFNIVRFLRSNPGTTVSDYNNFFRTNLKPEEFEIFETEAETDAVGMAMGGDPAMAQGVGSMMESVDPAIMQDMLMRAGEGIQDLENVDNYEQMMNMIRGDEASIPERRTELAGLVGEQDAAQTPESVLALVQPVVQIASVDEGIGGLAQETMTESVEGPMAEGIMSTMAPPEPAPMPPTAPPMMGGPPPANFKDGGLVRRGDNQPVQKFDLGGGVPLSAPILSGTIGDIQDYMRRDDPEIDVSAIRQGRLLDNINTAKAQAAARATLSPAAAAALPKPERSYDERVLERARDAEARYIKAGLGSPESRAADLEEQKKLTQAQMLFDIANTALAFAAPMEGERAGMSPAERLAMAARTTQLPQTIGARAQQQLEYKKAADKEERALKLAAVQRGETEIDTEIAAEQAIKLQEIKNKTTAVNKTSPFVTKKSVVIDNKTYPANTLLNLRPAQVAQIEDAGALTPYKAETGEAGAKKAYTVTQPITVNGVKRKTGDVVVVSSVEANEIDKFSTSVIPYKAPEKQGDVNVLFPDNTQQVLTPGSEAYINAIKPVSEGGRGGLLSGTATVPDTDTVNLRMPNGDIKAFEKNSPEFKKAIANKAVLSGTVSEKDRKLVNMINTETGDRQTVVEFSEDYYRLARQDFAIGSVVDDPKAATTKPVTAATDITFRGEQIKAGAPFYPTDAEIDNIKETFGGGAIVPYEKPDSPPDMFGKGDAGKALRYFSIETNNAGTKMTDLYAAGADDPVMESQISIYTAPSIDKSGLLQKRQLPDFMKAAIKKRVLAGGSSPVPLNTLGLTVAELQMVSPDQDVPLLNADNTVNIDRALADPTFIITGLDYTQSQGFVSSVNRFFNGIAGQLAEVGIGTGYAGNDAKITSAADKQLDALARKTINVARAGVDGRVFALDLQLLEQEVKGFQPGGVKSDVSALQQLRTVRSALASDYARAKSIVDANTENPAAFTDRVSDARLAMRDTEKLIAEYTAAIIAYEANLTPGGAAANVASGSATANSRRVNDEDESAN